MATYTSNINLKKPAQSDKIRIADFNGNADNIDAAIGADFGQGTKPSINQAINSLADGLAIIANGNVHAAITAGQFVYVRNHDTLSEGLYVASSNISANGTLSGSNLTADESGGLNALNSNIANLFMNANIREIVSSSDKQQHTLTVPNDSLHFLIIQSTSVSVHAYGIVATTGGGVIGHDTIQETSGITLTYGTGQITIDVGSTARPLSVLDIRMRGSGFCSLS